MKNLVVIFFILFFCACKKDKKNEVPEESNLIVFEKIVAEKDTIFLGQTTKLRAVYTGTNISFEWSATAGDIVGSGEEVTYVAPPCTPGNNTITCTAKAANKQETKTKIITVL